MAGLHIWVKSRDWLRLPRLTLNPHLESFQLQQLLSSVDMDTLDCHTSIDFLAEQS